MPASHGVGSAAPRFRTIVLKKLDNGNKRPSTVSAAPLADSQPATGVSTAADPQLVPLELAVAQPTPPQNNAPNVAPSQAAPPEMPLPLGAESLALTSIAATAATPASDAAVAPPATLLAKTAPPFELPSATALLSLVPERVNSLEVALYNASVRAYKAAAQSPHKTLYAQMLHSALQALPAQVGPFPDDIVGLRYLGGQCPASGVIEAVVTVPNQRELIRRMFLKTLLMASAVYVANRGLALQTAKALEASCFNAAVLASKESEEPPRRQWDSPAFVDIYSTRCGTINGLLDVDSIACRNYGAFLVANLLSGAISPENVGDRSARDICPLATAKERADILKRTEQKIEQKKSTLFKCPHCHERCCVYREVQRRCLDEPPDYPCLCLACGKRFVGRN